MLLHELQMWATKRFNDDKEIESELGDLLDDRLHGEEENTHIMKNMKIIWVLPIIIPGIF